MGLCQSYVSIMRYILGMKYTTMAYRLYMEFNFILRDPPRYGAYQMHHRKVGTYWLAQVLDWYGSVGAGVGLVVLVVVW